jgi:hypothetical protein
VVPAAIGSAIGAGKGAVEEVVVKGMKSLRTTKGLRGIAAKAGGRGVAGAVGALALSELARRHFGKTKTAAESANLPGQLYGQVQQWAKGGRDSDILQEYMMIRDNQGERTPSSRAAYYALHDELEGRGYKPPAPKMRERVAPRQVRSPTVMDTAAAAAVVAAPMLIWQLGIGGMTPTDKDLVLTDAVDRMFVQRHFVRKEASRIGFGAYDSSFEIGTKNVYLAPRGRAHPEDIAHEIGHASAGKLRRETIGSVKARAAFTVGRVVSIAIPLAALLSSTDKSFTTPEELRSRAKFVQAVGGVAALLQAPVLAEEALASMKAVQMMRRAGSDDVLRRAGKRLLPAFATYAAPAALPFLVAARLRAKASRDPGKNNR